jgi:XTP/dITP diphosphohydrolase
MSQPPATGSSPGGRPRLLIATGNQGKLREIAAILADLPVDLVGLDDVARGPVPEVQETGKTFLDNARLKARAYAAWSGLATLADDSGLEVDALGGRPGVHSARYAGNGASDAGNLAKLLAELEGVPDDQRGARFRCAAVLADPATGEWHAEAAWEGRVIDTPRGQGGFGYDPVFVPTGWSLTSAEVDAATKNASSHRSRAFRALRPAVERWAARRPGATR